jgi:hypothetical protein
LKCLQEELQIFLSYEILEKKKEDSKSPDMPGMEEQGEVDRFHNKEQNFSITWYNSLNEYYNYYLEKRLDVMKNVTNKGKKKNLERDAKKQAKELMKNPVFLIAHELYDALPIH